MIGLGLSEAMREAKREETEAGEKARAKAYQSMFEQAQAAHNRRMEEMARAQANAQAYYQANAYNTAQYSQPSYQQAYNAWTTNFQSPRFTYPPWTSPVIPAPVVVSTWATILGVSASASRADCERAYRRLAQTAHPDHGGTTEAMSQLNQAIAAARKATT